MRIKTVLQGHWLTNIETETGEQIGAVRSEWAEKICRVWNEADAAETTVYESVESQQGG